MSERKETMIVKQVEFGVRALLFSEAKRLGLEPKTDPRDREVTITDNNGRALTVVLDD